MPRCRRFSALGFVLSAFATGGVISAQDLAGQKVMTIEWDVDLKVELKVVHTAPLGQVFQADQQQGDWLWIASHQGWISRSAVMPVDEAIEHFDQQLEESTSAINYYHRGLAHQSVGDLNKAIADYDQAIEIAPEAAAYYVIRGNARNDEGEYEKAIADYDEAIRIEPSGAAYHGRGDASFEQGDYEQAVTDYSKAIEIDPEFVIALQNRGTAFLKQGQIDAAITDFDQAIRLNPEFAAAFASRGRAKARLQRYDDAFADFNKAIELDPEDHWPYNDLAWTIATSADAPEDDAQMASEYATKACELTEWQNSTVLTTLAAARAQAGDFDAAAEWIQKAMSLDDQDSDRRGKMLAYFQQQKPYRE